MLGFSSEMKQLHMFTQDIDKHKYKGIDKLKVNLFDPGSYMVLNLEDDVWNISEKIRFANFVKESVILFGSIVIFMAITALVLVAFAWLITE